MRSHAFRVLGSLALAVLALTFAVGAGLRAGTAVHAQSPDGVIVDGEGTSSGPAASGPAASGPAVSSPATMSANTPDASSSAAMTGMSTPDSMAMAAFPPMSI